MRIADLAGKRVAIWGLGREGRAALQAIRARLPRLPLTIFDDHPRDIAGDALLRLEHGSPDAAQLGSFDVLIKSPGISAWLPQLVAARAAGLQVTSSTALWFAQWPDARVIAVTGTKGKSTVSALIAHLLRSRGHRVALAGNIGMPLLELIDADPPPQWWVVELSSFQTREATHADVAVVVNVAEEHLDWHGSRGRYVADKLALASVADAVLVNREDPVACQQLGNHPGLHLFAARDGWHVDDDAIWRGRERVLPVAGLPLHGRHNAVNACAALAAVDLAGEDARAAAPYLSTFAALPHRLHVLGSRDGIRFVDDSIATTPAAALAALASFQGSPVALIVGGHDRALDWTGFARHVREYPPEAIVVNGANGVRIEEALDAAGGSYRRVRVAGLADAVPAARALLPQGGTVLLAPGAASFDQFRDYVERGCEFARLAGFDPASIGDIAGLGIR